MNGTDRPEAGWGFPEVQPYDEPGAASGEQVIDLDAPPPAETPPAEEPPSFHVPRRLAVEPEPISALRALAGALVAVAGVLLGIGALLWATDAPGGSPTVAAGRSASVSSPAPTPVASAPPSAPPSAVASTAPLLVAPTPAAPSPAAVPKLALTVLNNSNRTGLADRAARRFQAGGWPIKLTGNFTGKVTATTVYYAPGQLASAELLQRSFTGLVRVRPRFETLPGTGLTVVLTRDYNP